MFETNNPLKSSLNALLGHVGKERALPFTCILVSWRMGKNQIKL